MRVLLIERDPSPGSAYRACLEQTSLELSLCQVGDVDAALAALAAGPIDAVLLELNLARGDAFDVLSGLRTDEGEPPVVILSQVEDATLAVSLMKAGAIDVLSREQLNPVRLRQAVQAAARLCESERRARVAQAERSRLIQQLSGLLEASAALQRCATVDQALAASAAQAVALTGAEGATASFRVKDSLRVQRAGRARGEDDQVCSVALSAAPGRGGGELSVYRPERFDGIDQLAAAWLAQTAALAIDNSQLVIDSERATRLRENVLAIVSHDLRGPVATVRVAADELRETAPGTQALEGVLRRASELMERLLDDLLDAARVDGGTLKVAPVPQSLARLLDDARAALDPRRAVRFAEVSPEVRVLADRERVLQVLGNLLGNALKFTPPDGEVSVEVELDPGQAVVRVRDTGPGVPRAQRRHLFERFWSGRRTPGSAGLGLYIAQAVIRAHQGTLELEDSERGASFRFTLARAPQAAEVRSRGPLPGGSAAAT